MSRLQYFVKRTAQMLVLWVLIITFLFFFFRLMPGDITSMMMHQGANQETIEAFRQKWGLNKPLHIQYVNYMANVAHLDFGDSLQYSEPVWDYTKVRIFNSFILIAPGITLGYIIGSLWGAIIGNIDRPKFEEYGIAMAVFVGTFPIFFIALIFIIVFANNIAWLPTSGLLTPETSYQFRNHPWWRQYLTKDFALHYLLPFSVIVLRYSSQPALLMRTSMDEVMGQGFSFYNRITGLPKRTRMAHLMRHASLPVITFYPLSMSRSIGGLVLLEYVFSWPGIGSTLVGAVFARDFPVVQFVFILVATFILFGNFIIDILYGVVDPRVSIGDEAK